MTAAEYRDARSAGRCIWGNGRACRCRLARAGFCAKHYKRHMANQRKARAARYLAAKLAGRCVRSCCRQMAADDSMFCQPHGDRIRLFDRTRWNACHRASSARLRAKLRRSGLCVSCGHERLARGRSRWYGARCLARRQTKRTAEREARISAGLVAGRRCSNCLRAGCRENICPLDRHPGADEHAREQMRLRSRRKKERDAAKAGRTLQVRHCSACGAERCRADKCRTRPPEASPLRIEQFMSTGTSHLGEL